MQPVLAEVRSRVIALFRLSLFLFDVLLEPSGIYAMSTVLQEGCRYVVRSMSSLPVLSQSLLLPKKRRR